MPVHHKIPIRCEARVRARQQVTIPAEIAQMLSIREGDTIIIELKDGKAELRPLRRSYAGRFKGMYGDDEAYVSNERDSW